MKMMQLLSVRVRGIVPKSIVIDNINIHINNYSHVHVCCFPQNIVKTRPLICVIPACVMLIVPCVYSIFLIH